MNKTDIVTPVDLDYKSLDEALEAAELYTSLGFEVTKPLEVAGDFIIRVTK